VILHALQQIEASLISEPLHQNYMVTKFPVITGCCCIIPEAGWRAGNQPVIVARNKLWCHDITALGTWMVGQPSLLRGEKINRVYSEQPVAISHVMWPPNISILPIGFPQLSPGSHPSINQVSRTTSQFSIID